MKLLVLAGNSNEGSYQAITTFLQQVGVPYQAVILSNVTPDSSGNRLSKVTFTDTTTGQGQYQGVILTDSTFAACSPSCLSTKDWTTLNTYAAQYSVRVASYYTYPAAQWGLVPADSGVTYSATSPLNVSLTAAGSIVFSYLNAANPVPVSGVKAYKATTIAAANETTTSLLTAGGYTVAASHTTTDGREVLALTMDNNSSLLHSQAFSYGVINWVTKGIFLGSRRIYINPQIDDFLLGNWEYAPAKHPTCESAGTCPTYFATGPDLQALVNWQTNVQADPQFQSFRQTIAYNGVGTTWYPASDPIFAKTKQVSSQFWWLSHTWDHPNLDCYSQSKSGACVPATLAQSLSELNQNIAVASTIGVALDQTSMVTPYNSGLYSSTFMQAANQVGLKYIVDPEMPASPNTGIQSKLAPILLLTRMNSDMFYDASSPYTGVDGSWPDEYNDQYGPNGATPLYTKNQTYSQILDTMSSYFLQFNMLSYSPYLMEFHIANFATYDGVHSVMTDVLDQTMAKYKKLYTLPALSISMDNVGATMLERASYNAAGVVGVYTPGVGVTLTSTNGGTIPVTGICSQASCGTYGGQIQDNVVLAANASVTIPVGSNVGVSLSAVSVNPTSVSSGTSATGTITLSGPAPTGGVPVSLTSSSASVTVPASVTVAAGSTTATFSVSTSSVAAATTATLTGTYSGGSKTTTLTVTPVASVSLVSVTTNPTSVNGGASATGTVTLSGVAPTGGALVSLSSSTASAKVPASVTVAAGSTTATFTVSTSSVTASTTATLTGTYSSVSKTTTLTVTPVASVSLVSVTTNPTSVNGGASTTGTVTLSGAAPTGGALVSLSSSTASATVPASVTVAAGSTTATFTVSTSSVTASTTATLTGTYSSVSKTATLTITPASGVTLSAISVNPASVASFTSATGTVTLSAAAPTGGATVTLASNDASTTVPASVIVAAGSTSATFTVTTKSVAYNTSVTLTATYAGISKTAAFTVTPSASVALASVSANPASVLSGNSMTGTVTLTTAAPTGGIAVELWTTGAAAYVPSSVTVPAGATYATFTITTKYTPSTLQDTITAFYNAATKTAGVTVTAAGTLASVSVNPQSVKSGVSATGTVTLTAAAPAGGLKIDLWTTGTVAFVPTSVTVPAGALSATFTISTNSTTTTLQDTITAYFNGTSTTAPITVTP